MRTLIAIMVTALLLAFVTDAKAGGPFIDISIGAHATDWPDECFCGERELSNDNPIFVGRIGWQTDQYDFAWGSTIRAQAFWEHGSSVTYKEDTGFDLILGGIRVEW